MIHDKIKAQTQHDANRFRLEKNEETDNECFVVVRLKELSVDKEAQKAEARSTTWKPVDT